MLDIVIESPFLPQRKIKLDETKWTIEKLTDVIAGKIKVFGKTIDKNVVCYELDFHNGETYKICKIADYPMNLDSFKEKLLNMKCDLSNKLLTIKVTFSSEHLNKIGKSVKLLESDTLDNFIERSSRRNSTNLVNSIVNIDTSEIKTMDFNDIGLRRYSAKYLEYKVSVNSKWKNILSEMKKQKMIGINENKPDIELVVDEVTRDIGDIENEIDNIENNTELDKSMESQEKDKSSCSCLKRLFKKKPKKTVLKSKFHYNFDTSESHSRESNIESEDENSNINSQNEDLSYHDENILDDNELDGTMFYTWDDDEDFLID